MNLIWSIALIALLMDWLNQRIRCKYLDGRVSRSARERDSWEATAKQAEDLIRGPRAYEEAMRLASDRIAQDSIDRIARGEE